MLESPTSRSAAPRLLALALALLALALAPALAAAAPRPGAAPAPASIKRLPPLGVGPGPASRPGPSVAGASRASADGYRYSWAVGRQSYPAGRRVTGFWMLQQNEKPSLAYVSGSADEASLAHSVGQLWAIARGPSCMSDVEIGWMVSQGQYGDLEPHLFVYAWDCGVGLGYVGQSSIPWVQYSEAIAPNAALPHDSRLHAYGVDLYRGNWWFYYDGQWLGYIPHSAWTRYFPSTIREGEAGGEVAAPGYQACTAMGRGGLFGGQRGAALVGSVWYQRRGVKAAARLHSYSNDAAYRTGDWRPRQPGSRFRYGGPGRCGG